MTTGQTLSSEGVDLRQRLGHRPALLAPLSGITDVAFRRVAARFGAGLVVTEMVAAEGLVRGHEEARLRSEGAGLSPHVVQLVGRDPARMGEAARLAEAAGADVVDVNMGCPAKKVTGGLAGSALMREPDLALRIVTAIVSAVRVPVTVKMRLGWDSGSVNAPDLAGRFAAAGVQAITVHGRTRQQFYDGAADWSAIRAVARAVSVPVVANGDVAGLTAARVSLDASGAAAVMIGRAALGQPWLVGAVAAALVGRPALVPGAAERADAAAEHYDALLSLYGRRVATMHARKHLAAYADRAAEAGWGLPPAERMELVRTEEPARVVRLLRLAFAERWSAAA